MQNHLVSIQRISSGRMSSSCAPHTPFFSLHHTDVRWWVRDNTHLTAHANIYTQQGRIRFQTHNGFTDNNLYFFLCFFLKLHHVTAHSHRISFLLLSQKQSRIRESFSCTTITAAVPGNKSTPPYWTCVRAGETSHQVTPDEPPDD